MHDDLLGIARDLELRNEWSADARAEVERHLANPGIDDPALQDRTHLPFVSIDGPTSMDLDQALYVDRSDDGGFLVQYALADAVYYVPSTSALFAEALARGASYYFPGFSIPMLPRELSEGLVSLNPNVARRALVFLCSLDERGAIRSTTLARARIRSRAKLTFGGVQRFYDTPASSPIATEAYAESLRLLRTIGELRLALAEDADVVRYRRREVEVKLSKDKGAPEAFVVLEAARLGVEMYNEQISLLVNREGGRLLAESPDTRLQPIYRVHPAPDPEKLASLRALTAGIAKVHGLDPATWVLDEEETLNDFLRKLPQAPATRRVAEAVERQAILVNMRSSFSTEPARHFGVGAEVYARFSSPMREVVGVFIHKEMLELLDLKAPGETAVDETLRLKVVESANRARDLQRRVNDQTNRLVIDHLFLPDLTVAERPAHRGTVMGITSSKVHVELDTPGLDVKLYVRDLGKQLGGAWLELVDEGAKLVTRDGGELVCAVGDEVDVRVVDRDRTQDRWVLRLDRVVAD